MVPIYCTISINSSLHFLHNGVGPPRPPPHLCACKFGSKYSILNLSRKAENTPKPLSSFVLFLPSPVLPHHLLSSSLAPIPKMCQGIFSRLKGDSNKQHNSITTDGKRTAEFDLYDRDDSAGGCCWLQDPD
jgi:hypothetical protein